MIFPQMVCQHRPTLPWFEHSIPLDLRYFKGLGIEIPGSQATGIAAFLMVGRGKHRISLASRIFR